MFRVQYKERYPGEILSEWIECATLEEAEREVEALKRFDFVYGIEIREM